MTVIGDIYVCYLIKRRVIDWVSDLEKVFGFVYWVIAFRSRVSIFNL